MSRRRYLFSMLIFAGASSAGLVAGPGTGGTIPPGSNGTNVAVTVEANWNAGDDYTCSRTGNKLSVFPDPTPPPGGTEGFPAEHCFNRLLEATFNVTGGPNVNTTSVQHPYQYVVTCDGPTSQLRHAIAFDDDVGPGGTPTPINSGTFVFTLDNGDQLTIVTTEGFLVAPPSSGVADSDVPALGERGGLIVGAAVLALGALLIWRRHAASAS